MIQSSQLYQQQQLFTIRVNMPSPHVIEVIMNGADDYHIHMVPSPMICFQTLINESSLDQCEEILQHFSWFVLQAGVLNDFANFLHSPPLLSFNSLHCPHLMCFLKLEYLRSKEKFTCKMAFLDAAFLKCIFTIQWDALCKDLSNKPEDNASYSSLEIHN